MPTSMRNKPQFTPNTAVPCHCQTVEMLIPAPQNSFDLWKSKHNLGGKVNTTAPFGTTTTAASRAASIGGGNGTLSPRGTNCSRSQYHSQRGSRIPRSFGGAAGVQTPLVMNVHKQQVANLRWGAMMSLAAVATEPTATSGRNDEEYDDHVAAATIHHQRPASRKENGGGPRAPRPPQTTGVRPTSAKVRPTTAGSSRIGGGAATQSRPSSAKSRRPESAPTGRPSSAKSSRGAATPSETQWSTHTSAVKNDTDLVIDATNASGPVRHAYPILASGTQHQQQIPPGHFGHLQQQEQQQNPKELDPHLVVVPCRTVPTVGTMDPTQLTSVAGTTVSPRVVGLKSQSQVITGRYNTIPRPQSAPTRRLHGSVTAGPVPPPPSSSHQRRPQSARTRGGGGLEGDREMDLKEYDDALIPDVVRRLTRPSSAASSSQRRSVISSTSTARVPLGPATAAAFQDGEGGGSGHHDVRGSSISPGMLVGVNASIAPNANGDGIQRQIQMKVAHNADWLHHGITTKKLQAIQYAFFQRPRTSGREALSGKQVRGEKNLRGSLVSTAHQSSLVSFPTRKRVGGGGRVVVCSPAGITTSTSPSGQRNPTAALFGPRRVPMVRAA